MPTPTTDATPDQPTHPHVHVRLIGVNGNVFVIIGTVARALRQQVNADAAKAFTDAAYGCDSYDQVLTLAMTTVDVT